jgi:hypothetical protein
MRATAGHASHNCLFRHGDGLLDDGFDEVDLSGLGLGEAGFAGVARAYKFIYFGDDTALLRLRSSERLSLEQLSDKKLPDCPSTAWS